MRMDGGHGTRDPETQSSKSKNRNVASRQLILLNKIMGSVTGRTDLLLSLQHACGELFKLNVAILAGWIYEPM